MRKHSMELSRSASRSFHTLTAITKLHTLSSCLVFSSRFLFLSPLSSFSPSSMCVSSVSFPPVLLLPSPSAFLGRSFFLVLLRASLSLLSFAAFQFPSLYPSPRSLFSASLLLFLTWFSCLPSPPSRHCRLQRAVDEERHRLALEAARRKAKISSLQSKYAVVVQKVQPEEGEGRGERSQAYYIIKAGQEKEELQRIGDELDQKIRDAEGESRGLSRTLEQLRSANSRFRRALSEESSFVQQQRASRDQLEKRVKEAHDAAFEKKQQLRSLQEEVDAERGRKAEAEKFLQALLCRKQALLATLKGLQRDVRAQEEKLRRATDRHKEAVKVARKKKILPQAKTDVSRPASPPSSLGFDPGSQTNLEMEPHLESLRYHLQALRQALATALEEVGGVPEEVKAALGAHGVHLSSRPPSGFSSAPSSCGGTPQSLSRPGASRQEDSLDLLSQSSSPSSSVPSPLPSPCSKEKRPGVPVTPVSLPPPGVDTLQLGNRGSGFPEPRGVRKARSFSSGTAALPRVELAASRGSWSGARAREKEPEKVQENKEEKTHSGSGVDLRPGV
ncbi:hypothetical protein TGDOM2_218192 [Toxoplasma gondii GAB2-2007-GAL-DOM2]|uniref:Uncharacterized protein n=3 Tax=Toxoplasma gondii TaxID=5811 RepID=A0A086KSR5_TOXGO|nr:hypothetical protein TGDOM2_218192 [Toxoplasma gondii GAB2-2007-GAL-DOM2]